MVRTERTYFRSCEENDLKLAADLFKEFQEKRSKGSKYSLNVFGFIVMYVLKLEADLAILKGIVTTMD